MIADYRCPMCFSEQDDIITQGEAVVLCMSCGCEMIRRYTAGSGKHYVKGFNYQNGYSKH